MALADKVLDDEAEYVGIDDALPLAVDEAVVELLIDAVGELVMQTASAVGPHADSHRSQDPRPRDRSARCLCVH